MRYPNNTCSKTSVWSQIRTYIWTWAKYNYFCG